MVSGVAVYGPEYARVIDKLPLEEATRPQRLLFWEEGPTATVSVHQALYRFLRANGKTEASTGPDMHTQLVAGHLPLLLHGAPRRVLVIGLASGITVGAVARHPVERIDVVEIEPAMTRAAQFFRRENRDVLADPRVTVVIADARSYLLTRADRYDVIISEPSNPWIGGVATLFTSEFYALAARRLAPGGLML
jgi:spermidine synthase